MRRCMSLAATICLLIPAITSAQEGEQENGLELPDGFDKPMPLHYDGKGLGPFSREITTSTAEAPPYLDQGVQLLLRGVITDHRDREGECRRNGCCFTVRHRIFIGPGKRIRGSLLIYQSITDWRRNYPTPRRHILRRNPPRGTSVSGGSASDPRGACGPDRPARNYPMVPRPASHTQFRRRPCTDRLCRRYHQRYRADVNGT